MARSDEKMEFSSYQLTMAYYYTIGYTLNAQLHAGISATNFQWAALRDLRDDRIGERAIRNFISCRRVYIIIISSPFRFLMCQLSL